MQDADGMNAAIAPQADFSSATIVPADGATPGISDEECLQRLADALESNDADKLEEIAMLIGRLVVTIE